MGKFLSKVQEAIQRINNKYHPKSQQKKEPFFQKKKGSWYKDRMRFLI